MGMTQPVAILRTGAVTSVGLNAPSTFAALRTRLNNFTETAFIDGKGEPIVAGMVPLSPIAKKMLDGYSPQTNPLHRQIELLSLALLDCARQLPQINTETIPLLACVSELSRPARPANLDDLLFRGLELRLGCKFAKESAVYAYGQAGVGIALNEAFNLLQKHPLVFLVGVDSLTHFDSLQALHAKGRIFASDNTDGYIPGEAGCALLLGRPDQINAYRPLASNLDTRTSDQSTAAPQTLYCTGLSVTREMALEGGNEPNKGKGLNEAIRGALKPIQGDATQVGLRICSQITTHYSAKEMAIGSARAEVGATALWCLADSLGETGAVAGPLSLAWAYSAMHKGYAPSTVALSLLASEEGERSAALLSFGHYKP
jgi:3-oxoacyl-[acyl-carrier-protein] synthase-1